MYVGDGWHRTERYAVVARMKCYAAIVKKKGEKEKKDERKKKNEREKKSRSKDLAVSEEERAATKTFLQGKEPRQGCFRGGKSRAESEGEILSAPKTKDKGKNLVVIARG
ncbi:hypothetical protein [Slackia exigua]